MGFFRKHDELDHRLRDARYEPPAELLTELARSLQSAPERQSRRLRLGVAAGLTSILLVAFAAVGGAGYAANAASKAATAVSKVSGTSSAKKDAVAPKAAAKSSPKQVERNGHQPSSHQYGQDRTPICHHGRTLVLPLTAAQAHLSHHQGDTPGPCSN